MVLNDQMSEANLGFMQQRQKEAHDNAQRLVIELEVLISDAESASATLRETAQRASNDATVTQADATLLIERVEAGILDVNSKITVAREFLQSRRLEMEREKAPQQVGQVRQELARMAQRIHSAGQVANNALAAAQNVKAKALSKPWSPGLLGPPGGWSLSSPAPVWAPRGPPPMGASMGAPMGASMGGPPPMRPSMAVSMGAPMGPGIGKSMAPPMGVSIATPMGASIGTPIGVHMASNMGTPKGVPHGMPKVMPKAQPKPGWLWPQW